MQSAKEGKNLSFQLFWLVTVIVCLLFLVGFYCSLRFGTVDYSHDELVRVLSNPLVSDKLQDIIIDIRLPRILAAVLVGAAMATSGLIMQGVTRNSIADPGLLGINAGAGLALVIAYAFMPSIHYHAILWICFLGAVMAAFLVFGLSYRRGVGYHQLRLILSGAMVAALFSAVGQAVTIYFNLSESIIGWTAGGLSGVNWTMLGFIAPAILLALCLVQAFSHQLNILSLNETISQSLGQKTKVISLSLMGLVLILSAASVALVGAISFIGLLVPHLVRLFTSKDYRYLLPLTSLVGGTLLMWVDLFSRSINPPNETPLGTMISLIGFPAFLCLIRRETHL